MCLGNTRTSPMNAVEMKLNIEPLDTYISKRIGKLNCKHRTLKHNHPSNQLTPSPHAHK